MNMDFIAKRVVRRYVEEHLDKSGKEIALTDKEPYIVWKCKTLQNWKYLMSTDLHDGMYYEVTYNGDKQEWYLDAYKKFENRCISGEAAVDLLSAELVGHCHGWNQ